MLYFITFLLLDIYIGKGRLQVCLARINLAQAIMRDEYLAQKTCNKFLWNQ